MKTIYVSDETQSIDIRLEGDLTTVRLFDYNTGLRAHAHALRYRKDAYNEDLGIKLAYARATQRLARKIEKLLVREAG